MSYNWINYRDVMRPQIKITPKKERVDVPLSKAVGKEVLMGTTPHRKAIHLIAKWSANRDENDFRPLDYTKNPDKLKQLIEATR